MERMERMECLTEASDADSHLLGFGIFDNLCNVLGSLGNTCDGRGMLDGATVVLKLQIFERL